MTQMRREAIGTLFDSANEIHTGLWLARGLAEWNEEDKQKGKDFKPAHIKTAANFNPSEIYKSAYARWEKIVTASSETMATWCGQLDGRLFIGLGGASVLETAITLSRTYGVPMIPGSAIKGLTRAYAKTQLTKKSEELLFGKLSEKPEDSFAGYVLFHDAWWIPDSTIKEPLCQEIVTVHHQEYYNGTADRATDFDSPIPNAQIAAQGSFLFALECGKLEWAECARDLLAEALMDWGIGGKTAAGYGRFNQDEKYQQQLDTEISKKIDEEKQRQEEANEQKRLATLSPIEREMEIIAQTEPNEPKKYLTVLKALEAGKWQGDMCKQVAEHIKQWMIEDKVWREESQKKNPKRDKDYQRTEQVKKFLGDQTGKE